MTESIQTKPSKSETDYSVTGTLSTWVEDITLSSVPEEIKTRVKHLILDGIGCALVGARLPWSVKARDAVSKIEAPGKCTIFGWNQTLGPIAAAVLNSAFIQGFDMDDYHNEAPIHISSIIIPTVFAASEQEAVPIDGSSFLLASIVGYEVGPRVGLSLGGAHMLTIGWHSGAVFGPAAAAAAACKLLKLPADAVEDAIGMACTQACGLMSAQFESMIKRMQHGFAARGGLWATYLAREGFLGIKRVFDREYGGFLTMFSKGLEIEPRSRPEEICKGLGQKWEISKISVKPYALMAGSHCTVDCIRKLQGEHPQRMKDLTKVVSIVAEMARAAYKKGGWAPARPAEVIGAQMSVSYALALQLVDGEILPSHFAPKFLNRDELWDVINKIECRTSEEFDHSWAQRVTITFDDGEILTTMVKAPRGVDPPLSNEEIVQKWRSVTKGVISDNRQQEIESVILNIESVTDVVSSLRDLLGKETVNISE